MKVLSIKTFNFKGEDGNQVSGVHILVTTPSIKENIQGVEWDILKLSTENYINTMKTLNVDTLLNKDVEPIYNKYGKTEKLLLVK